MNFTTSPFATGGVSDPFAGAQFGFTIPTGDPGQIIQAAQQTRQYRAGWQDQVRSIMRGAQTALGGWSGQASSAFWEAATDMALAMLANAAAASDAAAAMETLANDLQTAQTRCRNALTDCETHQSAVQQAQAEAEDHARDANNYSDGAALSPDPHEQSQLNAKAAAATDQANAARQKASQAQAELEDSERAGRHANSDFQTAAAAASKKIAAAQSRLTKITLPKGGAPVPVNMTPSDIKLAQYLYLHTPPTIVGGGNRTDRIQLLIDELKAKGDTLDAGIIQAYDEMEKAGNKELTNPPTGNPLDAFDGYLHLLSLGLIKLGDPNSRYYQDGEMLSLASLLIPETDLGVIADGGSADVTVQSGKLDYLLGKIASNPHNLARSVQNLAQLTRLGFSDTAGGREFIHSYLESVGADSSSVTRTFTNEYGTFEVHDTVLAGPSGKFAGVESTFQVEPNGVRKLVTAILRGG